MLRTLRARTHKDGGFTLIELMIVVLIVAILIAIGIPTFLGARTKGQDRAAQVDLRQGLLTSKSYYVDQESFAAANQAATEAAYESLEPTLDFTTIALSDKTLIGVGATADDVLLVKQSSSGTFWCIAETESAGTTFGTGAALANVDTVAECASSSW